MILIAEDVDVLRSFNLCCCELRGIALCEGSCSCYEQGYCSNAETHGSSSRNILPPQVSTLRACQLTLRRFRGLAHSCEWIAALKDAASTEKGRGHQRPR